MLKPSKIRNLYPIFSVNRYPVGQYKVSVLDQINEIVELNPSTGILQFKDGSTLFGIIKAILLPPEDFSPYFAHNFGTLEKPDRKYCVCFSCANGKGNLKFCRQIQNILAIRIGKNPVDKEEADYSHLCAISRHIVVE